jgi:hypothetical protein
MIIIAITQLHMTTTSRFSGKEKDVRSINNRLVVPHFFPTTVYMCIIIMAKYPS